MVSRRGFLEFLGAASGMGLATFAEGGLDRVFAAGRAAAGVAPDTLASDEEFWREIQQAFTVDRSLINLNNGGVSPSPRVVQEAMRRHLEFSNQAPTYTMWQILEPQSEGVRRQLAAMFGCDAEEIAITRNASESLETCILGLDLKAGDEFLTTWQDYPRMLTTLRQRERRDGIKLVLATPPVPPKSPDELYALFERNITPRTKAMLVSHITFSTGQIYPVKRICELGRSKGIEVIVDGAHAFAHFPFTHADLDCDYYGTSLHKWLHAPHGSGMLYVRKSKIAKLWPLMAAEQKQDGDIRKFEEIGTHPAANRIAIAEAIAFHEGIGAERKAARLRYLKKRWADRLTRNPRVTLLTPDDPAQSCAIATLRVEGIEPVKLGAKLWERHRIICTPIEYNGVVGVRVTPSVYTRPTEVDRFCDAVEALLKSGLG